MVFKSQSEVGEWLKETLQNHLKSISRPDVTGKICINVYFGIMSKIVGYTIISKYANMSSGDLEVGERKYTQFDEFKIFFFLKCVVLCIGHKHNLQK